MSINTRRCHITDIHKAFFTDAEINKLLEFLKQKTIMPRWKAPSPGVRQSAETKNPPSHHRAVILSSRLELVTVPYSCHRPYLSPTSHSGSSAASFTSKATSNKSRPHRRPPAISSFAMNFSVVTTARLCLPLRYLFVFLLVSSGHSRSKVLLVMEVMLSWFFFPHSSHFDLDIILYRYCVICELVVLLCLYLQRNFESLPSAWDLFS